MDADNITTIIVALIGAAGTWLAARMAITARQDKQEAQETAKAAIDEGTGAVTQQDRLIAANQALIQDLVRRVRELEARRDPPSTSS